MKRRWKGNEYRLKCIKGFGWIRLSQVEGGEKNAWPTTVTKHVLFCIWLLSCHVIISRIIRVVWCISGSLLFWLSKKGGFWFLSFIVWISQNLLSYTWTRVISSPDMYLFIFLFVIVFPQLEGRFHGSRNLSDLFPAVPPAPGTVSSVG